MRFLIFITILFSTLNLYAFEQDQLISKKIRLNIETSVEHNNSEISGFFIKELLNKNNSFKKYNGLLLFVFFSIIPLFP